MRVQVNITFKNYSFFVTKKAIKKQTGSALNFLKLPIQVRRGVLIPCRVLGTNTKEINNAYLTN